MSWDHDRLAPVETLLYRGEAVKLGVFDCVPEHPAFACTDTLDNDVFVLPHRPLWWRRESGPYRYIERGGILLHRAGGRVQRQRAVPEGERTLWFAIHPDAFNAICTRAGLEEKALGEPLLATPWLRHQLARVVSGVQPGNTMPDFEAQVLQLFESVCAALAATQNTQQHVSETATLRRHRLQADRTRAFLDAHLTETLPLQSVADAMGTSLFHLCRLFREQTGLSLHAYRTRQRVGLAAERLAQGPCNLTHMAHELGFSSSGHFSRVFHRQVGVPPSHLNSVTTDNPTRA